MQIINESQINIDEIVTALKEGKTIVYPTETSYGLGCDATNQEAVDRIFAIKQRQKDKSLLVIVPDQDMAMTYAVWSPEIESLATTYWPGPLTIVTQGAGDASLADGALASDGTIAFRISSHPTPVEIAKALGKPLVSTSANISGQASSFSAQDIIAAFAKQDTQPDILIDAGELPEQSPSTIVRVAEGRVETIRQGEIIIDQHG